MTGDEGEGMGRGWGRAEGPARSLTLPRTALRGRWLLAARAAWVSVALLVVGFSVAGLFAAHAEYRDVCVAGADCAPYWRLAPGDVVALEDLGLSVDFYAAYRIIADAVLMLGFWVVGAVIFWRRSDDRLALFFSLMLVAFGALNVLDEGALTHPVLAFLASSISFFGYTAFFFSFFVFPDGRFSPRWGWWAVAVWVLYMAALFFTPEESELNPAAWPPLLAAALVLLCFGVMVFAQIHRYLRVSGPVERQQIKWVVFGLTAAVVVTLLVALPSALSPVLNRPGAQKVLYSLGEATFINLSLLLIPLSIGVAILRQRLWDIDLVINRTLVYAALTAVVVGVYVLVVGGLGALLQARGSGNLVVSLAATGLVAALFAPLRDRLQRGANRLMYGERDEPYAVLSRLGHRLQAAIEPDAVLQTIVETVAGALKLPYAAISIKGGNNGSSKVVAHHGSPTGEQTSLPLAYGGETIGELILAPRSPGEAFSPADRRLLEDLARNAEAAVHAVRLTADLQRSRERLISAREEERRRLRRDLHDGLGPTLGSLTLGLDVSMRLLKKDPEEAGEMLARLKSQTKEAVADIRRLVYGLRPPALDDLGLVAAVREQAAGNGRLADDLPAANANPRNGGAVVFSVEAPEGDRLPPLPAAVEVACYRIAQEAITNVVRHAKADSCRVRLSVEEAREELVLEVCDDGTGIPEGCRAGVGTNSMRERAAELGGTLSVGPAPGGGTRVLARLPLFAREQG